MRRGEIRRNPGSLTVPDISCPNEEKTKTRPVTLHDRPRDTVVRSGIRGQGRGHGTDRVHNRQRPKEVYILNALRPVEREKRGSPDPHIGTPTKWREEKGNRDRKKFEGNQGQYSHGRQKTPLEIIKKYIKPKLSLI